MLRALFRRNLRAEINSAFNHLSALRSFGQTSNRCAVTTSIALSMYCTLVLNDTSCWFYGMDVKCTNDERCSALILYVRLQSWQSTLKTRLIQPMHAVHVIQFPAVKITWKQSNCYLDLKFRMQWNLFLVWHKLFPEIVAVHGNLANSATHAVVRTWAKCAWRNAGYLRRRGSWPVGCRHRQGCLLHWHQPATTRCLPLESPHARPCCSWFRRPCPSFHLNTQHHDRSRKFEKTFFFAKMP